VIRHPTTLGHAVASRPRASGGDPLKAGTTVSFDQPVNAGVGSGAAGFLDATIRVPPVPDVAGVRRILARRAALALGDDVGREATVLDGLLDPAAVEILYAHYAGGTPDLRRRILYVAHTALTLACDSGAEVVGPAHVDLAISEVTHD